MKNVDAVKVKAGDILAINGQVAKTVEYANGEVRIECKDGRRLVFKSDEKVAVTGNVQTITPKFYNVDRESHVTPGLFLLQKTCIVGIRHAKSTASYFSISAPPVISRVIDSETLEVVFEYYDGRPLRREKKNGGSR